MMPFRRARAATRPTPINCRMGSWSSWTPCDSCTDKTLRFRTLEKPAQFGGTDCVGALWEKLACPRATTQCMVEDYCGESFTCKETGRCVSQSLRCNGEPDCEDFSDEEQCDRVNRREDKCSTLMAIPGAERGTQGYNILTGDFMNQVLDPTYFGGKCEYVYNGEWSKLTYEAFCESLQYNEDEKNYRKPYNYHAYRFVAEATSKGSDEYYEDMQSLLKARQTMSSSNAGVSVGVALVEVGLKGSEESEFLRNITKYQSQDLGFIRLWSKVKSAHFKMRSNQLMLHEDSFVVPPSSPKHISQKLMIKICSFTFLVLNSPCFLCRSIVFFFKAVLIKSSPEVFFKTLSVFHAFSSQFLALHTLFDPLRNWDPTQNHCLLETMSFYPTDAKTDGSWSCWGSWSSCSSGTKSRTRVCNNPAPDMGGAACLGSATQTHRC
uniref:Complement C8 alpha chain n=1 Tax=Fundulus heteroclitus TaxID=8078 RepID=A0A3Q2PII5_FUNHE